MHGLDAYDQIFLQGVSDETISIDFVAHDFGDGQKVEGFGIFVGGYLEAIYTGTNLSDSEVLALTHGVSV